MGSGLVRIQSSCGGKKIERWMKSVEEKKKNMWEKKRNRLNLENNYCMSLKWVWCSYCSKKVIQTLVFQEMKMSSKDSLVRVLLMEFVVVIVVVELMQNEWWYEDMKNCQWTKSLSDVCKVSK